MSLDDIVLVIDAQMPIRTKRIEYFGDQHLKSIYAAQSGDHPYPTAVVPKAGLDPDRARVRLNLDVASLADTPEVRDGLATATKEDRRSGASPWYFLGKTLAESSLGLPTSRFAQSN